MERRFQPDNDISRVFAQKVDRQFRKDFAKYLPVSQKTEESKSKINELNIKLIEAEEKILSLNRAISTKGRQIEDLQVAEKSAFCKIEELQEQVCMLKSELEKRKRTFQCVDDKKVKEKVLLNDYRTALSKYLTWYEYSEKQLELMKTFLEEGGAWTEENRYKIYFAYKEIEPFTVNDSNVADFCKISVLDYQGVEDVESISEFEQRLKFHNTSTQTDRFESGFLQNSEDSSQNPSSQGQFPSQQLESFHDLSVDDLRFLEHNERIQNLECENTQLKEQLIILGDKTRKNVLIEKQNQELENQLIVLRRENAEVIGEFEKFKQLINTKLFKDGLEQNNGDNVIMSLVETRERNKTLEKKLQELESTLKMGMTGSFSSEESKRIALFFKQKYQKEIEELKKKLAEFQPLHPSDTTCVYRFQDNNPLDEAHEKHLINLASAGNSNKRRKLDSSSFEENNSSSTNSEVVKDLRVRLEHLERTLKLQKDFALQYRRIVASLTGYQIKMREEGLCEVQSVFDQGGEFCFKKRSDDAMDLLDNECARQWKSHVTNYLAKYDSVPAFLASVLLALIESDASMLSTTFLNYTKDPQQDL